MRLREFKFKVVARTPVAPGLMEAELPDVALEAVARRCIQADLLTHSLLRLLQSERELLVHLREIGQGPLHLHAARRNQELTVANDADARHQVNGRENRMQFEN